jgi:hypothetical protein
MPDVRVGTDHRYECVPRTIEPADAATAEVA